MRILDRSVYVGPSLYARFPVIRLELDLGALESWPTGRLGPEFVDALAVCIQDCHLRFTRADGRTQDVHMESGETRWLYGDTHSAKNLNTNPMEMIVIEVKAANKDR